MLDSDKKLLDLAEKSAHDYHTFRNHDVTFLLALPQALRRIEALRAAHQRNVKWYADGAACAENSTDALAADEAAAKKMVRE